MLHNDRHLIKAKHLWWILLLIVSIAAGVASLFVNSLFIIAVIIMLVNVVLVLKYPIWGLLAYLIIYMIRPGELYPALAVLRMELLTGLLVVLAVVLRQKFTSGKITLPTDRISLFLFAFLIVMCLTVFVSYEKSATIETVLDFIRLLIFYYLIVSIIDSREKLVAFITVYLLLIAFIAFDSFKMYLTGAFVHRMGVDRMYGTNSFGGDPNSLANTLATTVPFIAASAFYFRNVAVKVGLWLLALGMAFLITVTASRGGLVAFGGVVLGGIIFARHKLVAVAAIVILMFAAWIVLPDQYKDRYRTLTKMEDIDQTSSGRWHIWLSGAHMIFNRPILGVGAGAFSWANATGEYGKPQWIKAHNLYIELMATTGVIGFAVWFGFIYSFVRKLRELMISIGRLEKYRWIRIYAVSFTVSLIALFISGLFAHSLYRYTWYLMAALTAVLARLGGVEGEKPVHPVPEKIESESSAL